MINKEASSFFHKRERKSKFIFTLIAFTGIICFAPRTAHAAADTAALNKQINVLWETHQNMPVDTAVARFHTIREACRQSGYTYGTYRAVRCIALIYNESGDLANCRRISRENLYMGDTSRLGQGILNFFYNQLANCDHKEGLYKTAAAWYYKALVAAIRSESSKSIVGVQTNIAVLMNDMGKPQSALYYLEQAIKMARAEHMGVELGNALANKAIAHDYLKQRDSCLSTYKEAIEIAHQTGSNQLLVSSLYGMGSTYYDLKQYDKALQYGRMAVQQTDKGDIYNSMFAYYVVGNAFAQMHRRDSALFYLEKFMSIAQNLGLGRYEAEANKSLGQMYFLDGQMSKAANHLARYVTSNDSLINAETEQQADEMQVKYRTAEQEKKLIQKELLLTRQEAALQQKKTMLAVVCGIIALALLSGYIGYRYQRRRRLEKQQRQRQEQQMMQLRAMLEGEEKERRRIARELHDDIGGLLTIARMRVDTLGKEHAAGDRDELSTLLDKISYGVRGTAHRLLPDIILRHKLPDVIRLLAEPIQHSGKLDITVQQLGSFEQFEEDTDFKLNVYRIVQELVSNILKHAQATEAVIELRHLNNTFEITVEDNGRGYDTTQQTDGIGLENVRMRVSYLGGELSVSSTPGTGTSVYIQIDLHPHNPAQHHAHPGIHSR
jgi:signal transduction histidine kinase